MKATVAISALPTPMVRWISQVCVPVMVMLGDAIVERGVDAGAVVREAAKLINGGGGGQKFFATAGGKNPDGLQQAIDRAVEIVKEKLA